MNLHFRIASLALAAGVAFTSCGKKGDEDERADTKEPAGAAQPSGPSSTDPVEPNEPEPKVPSATKPVAEPSTTPPVAASDGSAENPEAAATATASEASGSSTAAPAVADTAPPKPGGVPIHNPQRDVLLAELPASPHTDVFHEAVYFTDELASTLENAPNAESALTTLIGLEPKARDLAARMKELGAPGEESALKYSEVLRSMIHFQDRITNARRKLVEIDGEEARDPGAVRKANLDSAKLYRSVNQMMSQFSQAWPSVNPRAGVAEDGTPLDQYGSEVTPDQEPAPEAGAGTPANP